MKPGPLLAMLAMLLVGSWLVLQPTLGTFRQVDPAARRFDVALGAARVGVEQRRAPDGRYEYHFIGDGELESLAWIGEARFQGVIGERLEAWAARPKLERTLLGLFNISHWGNFAWIVVGLGGQACFFGRMLVQWLISEKSRRSVVPAAFWWMSLFGGVMLFLYFVWRKDFVGVLGQSTGVVIYARNLRLIIKSRRRLARAAAPADPAPEPTIAA